MATKLASAAPDGLEKKPVKFSNLLRTSLPSFFPPTSLSKDKVERHANMRARVQLVPD
jgi:hypothetical protein